MRKKVGNCGRPTCSNMPTETMLSKLPSDLAVVLQAEAHPVGEAGGGGALGGDAVLLLARG